MIRIDQVKIPISRLDDMSFEKNLLKYNIAKLIKADVDDIKKIEILRRSIDARDKSDILFVYNVAFLFSGDEDALVKKNKKLSTYSKKYFVIKKITQSAPRPVVVGAGPAGLFAAYALCKAGMQPILIERGKNIDARSEDVKRFGKEGLLNPSSNVLF